MALFLQVVQIVAPVFCLAAIGYIWMRLGLQYDVEFVTRMSMTLGVPCLIFMSLMRSEIDPVILRDTAVAALASYCVVAVIFWLIGKTTGLHMATYWAPLTFGNTGNIGLPVALFAFGQTGFDFAIVIFAIMAVISFSIGVWVVAGGGSPVTATKEPIVWASILGLIFMLQGWSVPIWMANTLDMVGQLAIPLMLITLGVAISRLQPRAIGQATILSVVKLAVCIAAPLAIGMWLGLPHLALGVLVLQVSTPVAVTSYMLASKYNAQADQVAGLVVVSTLISVVALPILLAFFV